MTSKSLPIFLAAGLLLVSCKKELMPQDNSDMPKKAATETATVPANAQPINVQPQPVQGQPQMVQTPAPADVKTAPGMNPPHGQPGHRCDIAVGAPLNSPKGNATTVTPGKAAANQGMTVTQTPVKTAPGMNPPHGQPGHRCDIGVGEPLSSAPKKAAATLTPVTPPAKTPALLNPDAAPVKTE
ncbi:hypothetical protein [Flavobacterium pallidum]|uniref:Uncharacterized protein n=1 Tax=Flavobacterium pallidum TaxID=2172098 RepID=A0A2S1SFK5_9FLAO|nr:hypothetical protein [Flavobacterium pallidum]AWI25127.1 hypothetical protein HYN49_04030 [Flavobacterium pallidum]